MSDLFTVFEKQYGSHVNKIATNVHISYKVIKQKREKKEKEKADTKCFFYISNRIARCLKVDNVDP